jgi:hypothetical protein
MDAHEAEAEKDGKPVGKLALNIFKKGVESSIRH